MNNQNIELFDRNEELIDLVRSLDEKMNVLEQFIIKNVEDGENRLMELINSSIPHSSHDTDGGARRLNDSIMSLSLKNMEEKLKSINQVDADAIRKSEKMKQLDAR